MHEGSKGVIMEMDAETIIEMAKLLGLASITWAVCIATGKTTRAAAALDMGWVKMTVSTIKLAITQSGPADANKFAINSARKTSAPEFSMATPKAVIPPISTSKRQSMER